MKEKMEIKKGDWFRCVKDFRDQTRIPSLVRYYEGKYYRSEQDGSITDTLLDKNHEWDSTEVGNYLVKLYTIQDLKDGKVAVENDGTVQELNKVLTFSFPSAPVANGSYKFYSADKNTNKWLCNHALPIPAQSVKDFLAQLPKEDKNAGTITGGSVSCYNTKPNDPINPDHYAFNIKGTPCDVFDIANAMGLDIEQATALRYFRKKKDPIEDTKKAIKCLERYLDRLGTINQKNK